MKRAAQRGQSMTEYLVVLGVTGAALIAATSDVSTIFGHVHNGYENQSREMSKVQAYNNPNLRFNRNEGNPDPVDSTDNSPPYDGTDGDGNELPDVELQLPTIEVAYDQFGNRIGIVSGNQLLDQNGLNIGWCKRSLETGDCDFVDDEGNSIFPGATSIREYTDDNGNPLSMMALVSEQNQVVGFVYVKNNKYYAAKDGRLLDPQPTNVSAKPTRTVYDLRDGKTLVAGYEYNGKTYSIASTITAYDSAPKTPENTELVSVFFNLTPPLSWNNYKPCLVMPAGWNNNLANGLLLDPAYLSKFNDPSVTLGSNAVGGFLNTTSQGCSGASSVTYTAQGTWTLLK